MKRIIAGILISSFMMGLLAGCTFNNQVQAEELTKEDRKQVQLEQERLEAEKAEIAEKAKEEARKASDLTMTSIQSQDAGISYQTVEGLSMEPGSYIAVVVMNTRNGYWSRVKKGMDEAVKALNASLGYKGDDRIRITYEGPADDTDIESQINIVDAVLSENPDVLCLAAIDMNSCQAQLETAAENGIPVIVLDSGIQSDLAQSVISTDNYQAGVEAAKRMGDALQESGTVGIMTHNSSTASSQERERGFREEMANHHPGITLLETDYESEETSVADIVKRTIEEHPELNGYFCTSGSVSEKVIDALKSSPDKEISIISFDLGKSQTAGIKDGTLYGSIVQNPFGVGYATIAAAARADMELPNSAYVNTGFQWIDAQTIENKIYENYLYE